MYYPPSPQSKCLTCHGHSFPFQVIFCPRYWLKLVLQIIMIGSDFLSLSPPSSKLSELTPQSFDTVIKQGATPLISSNLKLSSVD